MVWAALELVGRVASWVVGLFRRDMENVEWERGARTERLPALGHDLGDGPEDPLSDPGVRPPPDDGDGAFR